MKGIDVCNQEVDLHLVVSFEVVLPLVAHPEVADLHTRVPVNNITEEYCDQDHHLPVIIETMYVFRGHARG